MFKVSADEAAVVEQAREAMVNSGYFSEEQRSDAFNEKLTNELMQTQANIEEEVSRRATARAGRAEMKEQGQAAEAEEAARIKQIAEEDLANLTPETRKKLEDAQAAAAQFEADEKAKSESTSQRRKEFSDTASEPTTAIPGLNQYIALLQKEFLIPESNEPEDMMLHESLKKYFAELKAATASDPDNWRAPAADIMQRYPDLLERAEATGVMSQLQQKEKAERQEMRPSKGPEKEIPARQRKDINPQSGLILKNQEYDAMKGEGPWELDIEAKAIRRRKVMVANAMMGRPPVPFAIGDVVGFDLGSTITSGKILAIAAAHYIVETPKGVATVSHEAVFEPSATDLF